MTNSNVLPPGVCAGPCAISSALLIARIRPLVSASREPLWQDVLRDVAGHPRQHELLAGVLAAVEDSITIPQGVAAAKQRKKHLEQIRHWSRSNPVLQELCALHGASGVLAEPQILRPGLKKMGRPRNELLRSFYGHLRWLVDGPRSKTRNEGYALLARLWAVFGLRIPAKLNTQIGSL